MVNSAAKKPCKQDPVMLALPVIISGAAQLRQTIAWS